MHSHQVTSAGPQIAREIPSQQQRVRDAIGELGQRSDVLIGRIESVRRIPVPVGDTAASAPAPVRQVPLTPMGLTLDELAGDLESQIRTVNSAIDSLELS